MSNSRERAQELVTKLDVFKINMANDHVDFSSIENLLLNAEYRHLLNDSNELLMRYTSLYKQAINMVADEIFQISRYRFIAIPESELIQIDAAKSDPQITPQYYLCARHIQGLTAYIIFDVLQYDDPAQTIIAYERWVLIMLKLVSLNDFASAVTIYSVLYGTLDSFKPATSPKILKFIDHMEKVYDELKNKNESLRDHYMGRAIPRVDSYANFIAAANQATSEKNVDESNAKEKSRQPFAVEESQIKPTEKEKKQKTLSPHQKTLMLKTISTIKYLQQANAEMMAINYMLAIFADGFKEPRIFANEFEYEERLSELAKRLIKNKCLTERDAIVYEVTKVRKEVLLDKSKELFPKFREVVLNLCASNITKSQIAYQLHIHELRRYSRSPAKNKDGEVRRENLKAFLNDLSFESRLLEKIEKIERTLAEHTELIDQGKSGIYTSAARRILHDLINDLKCRNLEERSALVKFSVLQHESHHLIPPVIQDEAGAVLFNLPRLNLTNSKASHTVPVKTRVNFESVELGNMMTWNEVLDLQFKQPHLSDSDSRNSEEGERGEDTLEVRLTPLSSSFSSPALSPNHSPHQKSSGRNSPNLSPSGSNVTTRKPAALARLAVDQATTRRSFSGDEPSKTLDSPGSSEPSPTSGNRVSAMKSNSANSSPLSTIKLKGNVQSTKSDTVMPERAMQIIKARSADNKEPESSGKNPRSISGKEKRSQSVGSGENSSVVHSMSVFAQSGAANFQKDSVNKPLSSLSQPNATETNNSDFSNNSALKDTAATLDATKNENFEKELKEALHAQVSREEEQVRNPKEERTELEKLAKLSNLQQNDNSEKSVKTEEVNQEARQEEAKQEEIKRDGAMQSRSGKLMGLKNLSRDNAGLATSIQSSIRLSDSTNSIKTNTEKRRKRLSVDLLFDRVKDFITQGSSDEGKKAEKMEKKVEERAAVIQLSANKRNLYRDKIGLGSAAPKNDVSRRNSESESSDTTNNNNNIGKDPSPRLGKR